MTYPDLKSGPLAMLAIAVGNSPTGAWPNFSITTGPRHARGGIATLYPEPVLIIHHNALEQKLGDRQLKEFPG